MHLRAVRTFAEQVVGADGCEICPYRWDNAARQAPLDLQNLAGPRLRL